MSALINRPLPLIEMSAAHKMTARGYSSPVPAPRPASNAREGMASSPVHSFARRVHFAAGAGRLQAEAAKLDAAIAANLKELGHGP
jgi:hypothetical protein